MNWEALLLSQIVQISVLGMTIWFIAGFLQRKNSHLVYLLWLMVLVKCITPPFWSSPVSIFSHALKKKPQVARFAATPRVNLPNRMPLPALGSSPFESGDTAAVLRKTAADDDSKSEDLSRFSVAEGKKVTEAPRSTETLGNSWERGHFEGAVIRKWLLVGWGLASVCFLAVTVIRTSLLLRRTLATTVEAPNLQTRVDSLAQSLGLRRKISVRMTTLPLGPAVMGVIRPSILLPQRLIECLPDQDLDPILAHELIHIRRGDLWVGLLRHFACAVWWFHPLVWKAGNAVRRGAEECCDEEVVSSLDITPSRYARALLQVLELKQELKVIPVAPGVRPFDITAIRLEKIMKCGTRRTRTPIWCWGVAILLGGVALPGAGLTVGGEANNGEPEPIVRDLPGQLPSSSVSDPLEDLNPDFAPAAIDVDGAVQEPRETKAIQTNKQRMLPWAMLQRSKIEKPKIQTGDVLGVYVEGVLGSDNTTPPVSYQNGDAPAVGYPFPVRSDGMISLPLVGPLKVSGLTLEEAEEKLVKVYTVDRNLIIPGEERILLSMLRRKHIEVFVFREDLAANSATNAENASSRSNAVISMPAVEADILTALASSGGLPKSTVDEIVIQRQLGSEQSATEKAVRVSVVPLRYSGIDLPRIEDEKVVLHDRDIMIVRPRSGDSSSAERQVESAAGHLPSPLGQSTQGQGANTSLRYSIESAASRERWSLTLSEAISIALSNTSVMRTLGVETDRAGDFQKTTLRLENPHISSSDAQENTLDFLHEVCQAYWELHYCYHHMDAARTEFSSAHQFWKLAKGRLTSELEGGESADEAQSHAQFFAVRGKLEQATSELINQESRLRYLLGVSPADGRLLQPIDQPNKARVEYDWEEIKQQCRDSNPDLRRQRWRIKQQQMQLVAAREALLPQGSAQLWRAAIEESFKGDYSEWRTGFIHTVPNDPRRSMTQIRNQQLQLKRALRRLEDQELEVLHHLSSAVRRLRDRYQLAQTQYNALKASRDQVRAATMGYKVAQNVPLDVVLDAGSRQMQSKIDYFRAITEYQIANLEVLYRSGKLFNFLGVQFETAKVKPELPTDDMLRPARTFYPTQRMPMSGIASIEAIQAKPLLYQLHSRR